MNNKKAKSQEQLYREAERKIGDANRLFLEMVDDGLTKQELQKLIARRPALWGRFDNWLPVLPDETTEQKG